MLSILCVAVLLIAPLSGQTSATFSGTWRTVDTTMGRRAQAVTSPLELDGGRSVPPPRARELRIVELIGRVEVTRPEDSGRSWSLPLTGLATQVLDRTGQAVSARVEREGATLVLRTAQRRRLPGGPEVTLETEERHVLLADGSLQVSTTARSGRVTQTRQFIYQRVQ
jgi:hypothetical protein